MDDQYQSPFWYNKLLNVNSLNNLINSQQHNNLYLNLKPTYQNWDLNSIKYFQEDGVTLSYGMPYSNY